MSFLLWQRDRDVGIASMRRVLRAAEVPLLAEAQQLRDRLDELRTEQAQRIAAAGDEARAQGHALGLEEGRREARDELAAALAALAQVSAREHERLRGELGALALQVVRKLMGQFAADAVLAALAETAVRDLLPAQSSTLMVHPDLCDTVRGRLATATATAGFEMPAMHFEVQGDPTCARDACRIETEHGSVDASLEVQLQRLASAWGVSEGVPG